MSEAERAEQKRHAIAAAKAGKSQRDIAGELGVTHQTVSNWIGGKKPNSAEICQNTAPSPPPAPPPPMSEAERAAWEEGLKEGGQMIAEFAERQAERVAYSLNLRK